MLWSLATMNCGLPVAVNSLFVTSQMLWPLATTNYSGRSPQNWPQEWPQNGSFGSPAARRQNKASVYEIAPNIMPYKEMMAGNEA